MTRRKVLDRDGWRCQAKLPTGETHGKAGRLEVHHRKSLKDGGPMWDLDNLTTTCISCHQEEHRPPVTPHQAAWQRLLVADSCL